MATTADAYIHAGGTETRASALPASTAALLAVGKKTKAQEQIHDGSSDSAGKAALLAYRVSEKATDWHSQTGNRNALTAAAGAAATSARKRAESSPAPLPHYPDVASSAHNSRNSAAIAHRPSTRQPSDTGRPQPDAVESARLTHIGSHTPKEMCGVTPPGLMEVDEQNRQAALRASAISMAKGLHDLNESIVGDPAGIPSASGAAACGAVARPISTSSNAVSAGDIKTRALQYIKVQDQAQKLAAERLAKLNPDSAADIRDYYGYNIPPKRSRLSVRRGRRRAASEGGLEASDDAAQSRRIKDQMSIFTTRLAQVDAQKRRTDQENLLAAAERRVHAQMHTLDEKIFMETGRVPPAMMDEWEAKTRLRATEQIEGRLANHARVHIGGGKFLDQAEIDAVAAKKVAPTLNEISEAAEARRAHDEERRLEEAETKRLARIEKEREAERKAEDKRIRQELKAEEKARKMQERTTSRAEREIGKARQDEERWLKQGAHNESKGKQEHHDDRSGVPIPVLEPRHPTISAHENGQPRALEQTRSYHAAIAALGTVDSSDEDTAGDEMLDTVEEDTNAAQQVVDASVTASSHPDASRGRDPAAKRISFSAPTSPVNQSVSLKNTGDHGIRSLFNCFKYRTHLSHSREQSSSCELGAASGRTGFIGGAALGLRRPSTAQQTYQSSSGISSLSSADDEGDDRFFDAGEGLAPQLPLPQLTTKRSAESPQRDSRFLERF